MSQGDAQSFKGKANCHQRERLKRKAPTKKGKMSKAFVQLDLRGHRISSIRPLWEGMTPWSSRPGLTKPGKAWPGLDRTSPAGQA